MNLEHAEEFGAQPFQGCAPRISALISNIPVNDLSRPPRLFRHGFYEGYSLKFDLRRELLNVRRQRSIWLGRLTDAEAQAVRNAVSNLMPVMPDSFPATDINRAQVINQVLVYGMTLAKHMAPYTPFTMKGYQVRPQRRRTVK